MKDGGSATRPKYIGISAYRLFQTEVVCFERVVLSAGKFSPKMAIVLGRVYRRRP